MEKLERYLDQVCRGIGGPRSLRQHIRQELREHLLDAAAEHRAAGLAEEEALLRALEKFGGPAEIGSELAATHGHRLLATVIDKAIEWKEKTMKAKWLWDSWALIAVLGVLATEVLCIMFSVVYLIPKYQYLTREGWLQSDNSNVAALLNWSRSFLGSLERVCDFAIWLALGAAVGWGLFEWRVRGENKSSMRLAMLGSAALGFLVVIALMSGALIVSFEVAIPEIVSRPPERILREHVRNIDASIAALELALAKRDWNAIWDETARVQDRIDTLAHLGALAAFKPQLNSAKKCLERAQEAIPRQDPSGLEAELREFRKLYAPIHDAAKAERELPPPVGS
jgi:hypothetical protein